MGIINRLFIFVGMNVLIVCDDGKFLSPLMANYISFFCKTKAQIYYTNITNADFVGEVKLNSCFLESKIPTQFISHQNSRLNDFYICLSLTSNAEKFVAKLKSTYSFNYNFYLSETNSEAIAADMKLYAQRFCRVHLNEFM